MNTSNRGLFFAYKITCLIIGFACIYLGYRLFSNGVVLKAGDVIAKNGDAGLTLKEAAPGTFFCVFGAIIITMTIYKGFRVGSKSEKLEENPESNQKTIVRAQDWGDNIGSFEGRT